MPKLDRKTLRILTVLADATDRMTALNICQQADLGAGSIYPRLARLERDGWLDSEWETPEPLPDRPRRRFYRPTPHGRTRVLQALGRYEWNGGHT